MTVSHIFTIIAIISLLESCFLCMFIEGVSIHKTDEERQMEDEEQICFLRKEAKRKAKKAEKRKVRVTA